MSEKKIEVDPDAIEWWVIAEGRPLGKETIMAMVAEIRGWRAEFEDLNKRGCGYRECGLARSGFSGEDEE